MFVGVAKVLISPHFVEDSLFLLFFSRLCLKGLYSSLRKQTYSNILKILPPKMKISDKNSDIFHISAQNIDCGYLPFYFIKVGFKGVKIM